MVVIIVLLVLQLMYFTLGSTLVNMQLISFEKLYNLLSIHDDLQ